MWRHRGVFTLIYIDRRRPLYFWHVIVCSRKTTSFLHGVHSTFIYRLVHTSISDPRLVRSFHTTEDQFILVPHSLMCRHHVDTSLIDRQFVYASFVWLFRLSIITISIYREIERKLYVEKSRFFLEDTANVTLSLFSRNMLTSRKLVLYYWQYINTSIVLCIYICVSLLFI